MSPIRHVLAATDFSPSSLHAVERGFELARTLSARYAVMSALGLDALGPLRNLLGSQAEDVASTLVQKQRDALAAMLTGNPRSQGIDAELRVEPGLVTTVLPAYAAAAGVDLTIIGARGQSKLRRLLMGSTASHLLRKSRCPVLIVKQRCDGPYRRVLIPVDFSSASAPSIGLARTIAPQAELVLLHVFDVPFEGMLHYAGVTRNIIHHYRSEARQKAHEQLHALAQDAGLAQSQYTVRVEYGDATREILACGERDACDLLVMGKHGTHVTEELLLGSVTKRVLERSSADVLVVAERAPDASV